MAGQAFYFNGPNQTVNIPNSPSLNPTNAMTIECWVNVPDFTSNDGPVIVGKDHGSGARQYLISLGVNSSGQRIFRPHIGTTTGFHYFDPATVVQLNTWYHIALTYDGAALRMYVNGKLDGSLAVTGTIVPTANPLAIGAYTFGPWNLIGRVDEVSLYNRALLADEIQAIYTAGSAGKCPATTNQPPVPLITVSPVARFPGNTNLIVISRNGINARVKFDGSKSFDPAGTNLFFYWYEGASLSSMNAVATDVLRLGTHEITLRIDDALPLGTNSASVTVHVISASEAVGIIIGMVQDSDLSHRTQQPLMATLPGRGKCIRPRGDQWRIEVVASVREQGAGAGCAVRPGALARDLIAAAGAIQDALMGA